MIVQIDLKELQLEKFVLLRMGVTCQIRVRRRAHARRAREMTHKGYQKRRTTSVVLSKMTLYTLF